MFNRIYILIIALLLVFSGNCLCAEKNPIPGKISYVIKEFLVSKDPALANKKIEISYKYVDRVFKELQYRKGILKFSVAELYPDFKPLGNIIIPIQVNVDGVDKDKIFIRTKVSVYDKILIAKKRMKKGDLISEDSVTLEERDVAALSPDVIRDASLAYGKEAKTFVPQNNAVYEWMLRDRPFVRRNEKVKVISSTGELSVTVSGIALQDAGLGEQVKVKNLDSGKEIIAVVSATSEVTVK